MSDTPVVIIFSLVIDAHDGGGIVVLIDVDLSDGIGRVSVPGVGTFIDAFSLGISWVNSYLFLMVTSVSN